MPMLAAAPFDCVVVGAGPAGLTAAIYLARYHLSVCVIDGGDSRAASIPRSNNLAGFPGGIEGKELLRLMAGQACGFGARIDHDEAQEIVSEGGRFQLTARAGKYRARTILLATGVTNRRPPISDTTHEEAVARGMLRYCPICDGFEVSDQRIAVLGHGNHGAREAIFLRSYSADVTFIASEGPHRLRQDIYRELTDAGIILVDGPPCNISLNDRHIDVETPVGLFHFDTLYPALGSVIRSDLAGLLGADLSDEGCLLVDAHQRSSVKGLYAAGDVVAGLDQISHAMGEGGVAATTIRNDLARLAPLRRSSPSAN
jgi:thioredoxin reductase (NADPH)